MGKKKTTTQRRHSSLQVSLWHLQMQNQTHARLIKDNASGLCRGKKKRRSIFFLQCNILALLVHGEPRPGFYLWGVRSRCVWGGTHSGMAWCPRFSDAWSMHTVAHMPFACCFLARKMRGMALHRLLTRPDRGAEEFTVCCHCCGTVSPRIAVSPPIFP